MACVEQVDVDTPVVQSSDKGSILHAVQIGGTTAQQAQLGALLEKYSHIFAVEDEDLGYTDSIHEIHLTDDTPITQPYRRIPPMQYKEVKENISQLLRKGG